MLILRPRRVRIHQLDPAPTLEGLLVSSLNGHYKLLKPSVLESPERSLELSGDVWVPKANVIFIETVRA